MILLPDESQPDVYRNDIAPNLKKVPPWRLPTASTSITTRSCRRLMSDVIMVAPKGPGHTVRSGTSKAAACRP